MYIYYSDICTTLGLYIAIYSYPVYVAIYRKLEGTVTITGKNHTHKQQPSLCNAQIINKSAQQLVNCANKERAYNVPLKSRTQYDIK